MKNNIMTYCSKLLITLDYQQANEDKIFYIECQLSYTNYCNMTILYNNKNLT